MFPSSNPSITSSSSSSSSCSSTRSSTKSRYPNVFVIIFFVCLNLSVWWLLRISSDCNERLLDDSHQRETLANRFRHNKADTILLTKTDSTSPSSPDLSLSLPSTPSLSSSPDSTSSPSTPGVPLLSPSSSLSPPSVSLPTPLLSSPSFPPLSSSLSLSPSSPSSSLSSPIFLIFGIPTVSRPDPTVHYLSDVLASLASELPHNPLDPLFSQIQIWVMNNNQNQDDPTAPPPPHTDFEACRQRYQTHPSFVFLTNPHELHDSTPGQLDHDERNKPGWKVRKQTRDIVSLARAATGRSHYYVFLEDDFGICPRTIGILRYVIEKAYRYRPNWLTIKFSYGMNGFLIHNNEDLIHFSNYMLDRQRDRPPDHLMVEWSAGESPLSASYKGDRPHMTYRYNLWWHLGHISSIRAAKKGDYAPCYHRMNTQLVFATDAFDENKCGEHDDLSPCVEKKDERYIWPYSIGQKEMEEADKK